MNALKSIRDIRCVFFILLTGLAGSKLAHERPPGNPSPNTAVWDFSGLVWLDAETFLVVHDAKNSDENDLPRVSLLRLPLSREGVFCTPLDVTWPGEPGPSNDLESIARIPGTRSFLLVESGSGGTDFQRLFLADYAGGALHLQDEARWPVKVENVEGTAVAQVGEHLVFLFAERAHGQPSTQVAWATVSLDPFALGAFEQVTFQSPDAAGPESRLISSLEVDSQGRIYAASAFDPNQDNGPFRSTVWEIGALKPDSTGQPVLILSPTPTQLAVLDGLKVESIAVRELRPGAIELFIGTDDENYGAVIRPLPERGEVQGTSLHGEHP